MTTRKTHDTDDALAALVHRMASPLGAIANFAYLLPAETAPEAREGLLAAMASARATLQEAQRLLDALTTARDAVPQGGVDFGAALHAAAARREPPVDLDLPPLPLAAVPPAAAARLADALLAAAGPARLRVERDPAHPGRISLHPVGRTWSADEAGRAFALFPPRASGSNDGDGELAVAGSLARRVGGRAWGSVGSEGAAVFHLVLPTRDAATPSENPPEEQDA